MKSRRLRIVTIALLPLGLAVFSSCSSDSGPQEQVVKTADGTAVIETYKLDATVEDIDVATRKVTIADANDKRTTFKAPPDKDISRLQIGDRVRATLTEEVAVSLRKGDASSPGATETTVAAAVASGGETAAVVGDEIDLTSKITAVNPSKHRVTLQLPDGSSKTIKVSKNVDLSQATVGDNVVVRITEAVAIDFQER